MAVAIMDVIAWQFAEAMAERKLSKIEMAERLNTSRAQLAPLLDPAAGNVTLDPLQRAIAVLGRKLPVELV